MCEDPDAERDWEQLFVLELDRSPFAEEPLHYGLCPRARTPEDRKNCDNIANIGGAAFTILCAFPF